MFGKAQRSEDQHRSERSGREWQLFAAPQLPIDTAGAREPQHAFRGINPEFDPKGGSEPTRPDTDFQRRTELVAPEQPQRGEFVGEERLPYGRVEPRIVAAGLGIEDFNRTCHRCSVFAATQCHFPAAVSTGNPAARHSG